MVPSRALLSGPLALLVTTLAASLALASCGTDRPTRAEAGADAGSHTRSDIDSRTSAASRGGAPRSFVERFDYAGDPAFRTEQGGRAVWWDQDSWDARTDTHYESQAQVSESDPYLGGFVAVEKAADARDLTSAGVVAGASPDGSAGVGVMRVDFQGVSSARLRNPMLISRKRPGVVTFWAPFFATTGHWWEVAITPASQVVGAEYTAIPGRQPPESLDDPVTGGTEDGSTNGPGHRANVQDAINVISTGYPDAPACDDSGWHVRWAATRSMGDKVTDFVHPSHSLDKLATADPRKRTQLRKWQIVYTPKKVRLYSATSDTVKLTKVASWPVKVPWKEVYVHLLYVGYQAGHHPQADCGLHTYGIEQGQEMGWRDVMISPVKYRTTYALPGPTDARRDGWYSYDLRDLNYHRGSGQPNSDTYDEWTSYAYCSLDNGGGYPCPTGPTREVRLPVTVADGQLDGLARVQLLADVRRPGSAVVYVNDQRVGVLAGQAVRPDVDQGNGFVDEFEPNAWFRKSLDLPLDVLHEGANEVRLVLTTDTDIELDRLQLELDVQ